MADSGSLKINAGSLGGRVIRFPAESGIRPTSGKLREALFSSLNSRISLAGLRVLDLFSGSGALGIEAISRGAEFVTFVEKDRFLATALKTNLGLLGVSALGEVCNTDVLSWIRKFQASQAGGYGLVLADPPYRQGLLDGLAEALLQAGLLQSGAYLLLECDKKESPLVTPQVKFEPVFEKIFGDSKACLYHHK